MGGIIARSVCHRAVRRRVEYVEAKVPQTAGSVQGCGGPFRPPIQHMQTDAGFSGSRRTGNHARRGANYLTIARMFYDEIFNIS